MSTVCFTATASSLAEAEGTLKSDRKLVRSSTRALRRNVRSGDSKVGVQPYESPMVQDNIVLGQIACTL